ncbi:ABC transporter substrate-binding protein [Enterococcus timonensis]|uniref:ABC transporter substrate-binding protein n=1 Tax=Enterococcus timonensis TaxID=1852364 RepID=UPI0008D9EFE1|nr:extracellular solute-binding protein [Enterococcus timonensis]
MKNKKLLVGTLAVATLLMAACGSSKQEDEGSKAEDGQTKVSFAWWGSETRHKTYIEAIEAFEKANPDIDIEYEYSAWDDYWKKLATKAAAGELPDVLQMDLTYVAQYGGKNQLADMSEFLKDGGTIDTTNIDKSLIETGKLDDKLYGAAPAMNSMGMLVNKDFLAKDSVELDFSSYTYQDFEKAALDLKKDSDEYGFVDNSDNSVLLQYYLRSKGEDLYKYNEDGKPEVGFSEENFVSFMQSIQDMVKAKAMPTAEVVTNIKSFDEYPLSLGKAGLYQTWTNQFVTFTDSAAEGVNLSLELPYDSGTGALSYRPTFFYSIAETSKVKDAAAKFVNYMINDEEGAKILGTERGIPSNSEIKAALYPDMTDIEKATADYLENIADVVGDPSPIPPMGYSELNSHFKDVYAEITYETMTPKEAYDSYVAKAKEIFEENYAE